MADSSMLDTEARLANDHDGSYKTQLIEQLEKYQNQFTLSKQEFLPPEEYELVEHLEISVKTAITIIKEYKPPKGQSTQSPQPGIFIP